MALKFDGDKDKLSSLHGCTEPSQLHGFNLDEYRKGFGCLHWCVWQSGRQNCFGFTTGKLIHGGFIIATDGSNNNHGPPNAGASAHGEWVLVTLTKDANGSATYVDGQRSNGTVSHEYMSNRSTLYLGANPDNGSDQWYKG